MNHPSEPGAGLAPAAFHLAAPEREPAEEALRVSEARFRGTFENAAVGIAHVDPSGRWLRVNQRLCDIVGYTRAALLRQTFQDLTHPDDLAADLAELARLLRGEISSYRMEKRYFHRDGHVVWINLTTTLQRDGAGQPLYCISIIEDISARKQAEAALQAREADLRALAESLEEHVRQRTAELQQANRTLEQRNRELQDFAYVASHDLQEPLRKIQAFAGLMQSEYAGRLDDGGTFYLERMQDAAARMSQLINDLLAFSRVTTQARPFAPVDLGRVAETVLSDLEILMQETRGLVDLFPLPTIEADATQMRQLLQNLLTNALRFHQPEARPRVCVQGRLEEAAGGQLWCRLTVTDNGIGFDEKYLDRIFAPFQRLHGRGTYEGTGMGLAICRRIAERHGGTITAESIPGAGATFIVLLPARHPVADPTDEPGQS